ncbi:tyrosine-type recombinase/integrase [uncultured Bradyrhizobium sp.]|uniref:tyrosine-type recombinase/integrase n=1 Tax=uncultured Bradyrhizobium sp. TaxID=199684 RepID=UPI0035CC1599
MRKSVTRPQHSDWSAGKSSLYARDTQRKFLNDGERRRAIAATAALPNDRALFVQVLAWTGARVSEVLALTPRSFQIENGFVTIVTLKRRKFFVREVPIPDDLLTALERFFGLASLQCDENAGAQPLWPICRMTAWRSVKTVMRAARIVGPQASPKGFRHAFGHAHCRIRTPLHVIQGWMGHARLSTTAIYMGLSSAEERVFAERLWCQEPLDAYQPPPTTQSMPCA